MRGAGAIEMFDLTDGCQRGEPGPAERAKSYFGGRLSTTLDASMVARGQAQTVTSFSASRLGDLMDRARGRSRNAPEDPRPAVSRGQKKGKQAVTSPADEDTGHGEADPKPQRTRLQKLAHELKTPLSAIASAAEVMRDERFGPLDARYKDYSEDIARTARHALDVINDMLSGREGAQAPVSFPPDRDITEIDTGQLVTQVASSLMPLAQRTGLALEVHCEPDLPRLVGEAVHIRQILLNLFTNSARHTPAGGHVAFTAHFDRARGLVLAVGDTGSGMTVDQIARVLASASPNDGPAESVAGPEAPAGFWGGDGLGMGLGIVSTLAAANGGRLEIDSPVPGQSRGTLASLVFGMDRLVFS